ncbi:MAG: gliding motility-associated-like protein, partial [Crocinitomicaceae bacterium]
DQSTGFGINNWLWDFGDNNGSNVQDPIHGYADGGDYEIFLIVTDANGCEDTVSKFITIALPPALPTGFTPNGDGENDVFIIRGGPFKTVDFKVYNQWGELIYNSNDAAEGWDGTYQGEPALLGVYTWTYVIELANNKVLRESGDVTLMR